MQWPPGTAGSVPGLGGSAVLAGGGAYGACGSQMPSASHPRPASPHGGGGGGFYSSPPKSAAPAAAASALIVAQMAEAADAKVENRRSLAYLATLSLLCLFASPTVIALHLAVDPDSAFWLGRWGLFALAVPATIIFVHIFHVAHVTAGGRSRSAFSVAAVIPALTLVLVGGVYARTARRLDLSFFESEEACAEAGAPAAIAKLQVAYDEALAALEACAKRSRHHGLRGPTLQMCNEWNGEPHRSGNTSATDSMYRAFGAGERATDPQPWVVYDVPHRPFLRRNFSRELRYLATTEADHACSSFCSPGPMLWHLPGEVVGFRGEVCAPLVAEKLRHAASSGMAVLWGGLLSGLAFLALLGAAGPLLTRAGYA
mmetsp:Transcript_9092/g.26097  ORF Transcript_9092/g.26097 Transcript_9092/m.26097 type:complete len:372 (+) Transcript_9092:55-1170(+)